MELGEPVLGNRNGGPSPHADTQASRTWAVVRQLGPLWPSTLITGFMAGLLEPSSAFVGINFFAQQHTTLEPSNIHCELTPETDYCTAGVIDAAAIMTKVFLVNHVFQILAGPTLGALSDSIGRKPVMTVNLVLASLPLITTILFIFFNTTMYLTFALLPMTSLSGGAVVSAYVIDQIRDPGELAAAFGICASIQTFCAMLGTVAAIPLSMRAAHLVTLCLTLVLLAYLVLVMPESLPHERRRPLTITRASLTMPFQPLGMLVRNRLLATLTAYICCTSFIDASFGVIGPSYMIVNRHIRWTKDAAALNGLLVKLAVMLWLAFGLERAVHKFGEVGAMAISRCAAIILGVVFAVSSDSGQLIALNALVSGPIALGFPAVQALKSRAVGNDEQGSMQAALTTAKVVAESLGPALLGAVFVAVNRMQDSRSRDLLSTLVFLAASLTQIPMLALIASLPKLLAHQPGRPCAPGQPTTGLDVSLADVAAAS